MSEALVPEIETAVGDLGRAVMQLQKYRLRDRADAVALIRGILDFGDRTRGAHHRRALDAGAAAATLAEAQERLAAVNALLDEVRSGTAYRAAVAAHAARDHATLAELLPAIFADLTPVRPVPDLHLPVAWIRRARPRPPTDLAEAAAALVRGGLEADGDPLAAGVDPELPAVTLDLLPATDEPLVLRMRGATIPPAVFRVDEAGTHLVHVPHLTVPAVAVVPRQLDDDALGEFSVDWESWRAALVTALEGAGVRVVEG